MSIKVILVIILVVIIAFLSGFNSSFTCTIWFFKKFENVPVFALIIGAFVLGVLFTLPFTFGKFRLRRQLEKTKADLAELKASLGLKISNLNESEITVTPEDVDKAKKSAAEESYEKKTKTAGSKIKNFFKK